MVENVRNTSCPYCHGPIRPGEHAVWCAECGVGHHEICWVRNSGCTTTSCHGMPKQPVSRNAGASLERLFGVSYSDDAAGKLCPYCQTSIQVGEQAMICGKCGIPHHHECWQHNGGCTTYGCVPRSTRLLGSGGVQGPIDLSNMKYEPDPDVTAASWILGSGALGFSGGLVLLLFGGGFIGVLIATVCGCIAGAVLNGIFGSGKGQL